MAGLYTDIYNVVMLDEADPGQSISVVAYVSNTYMVSFFTAVTMVFDGSVIAVSPDYRDLQPGTSGFFVAVSPLPVMPDHDVTVIIRSFWWDGGGSQWIQDDMITNSVKLKNPIGGPEFDSLSVVYSAI